MTVTSFQNVWKKKTTCQLWRLFSHVRTKQAKINESKHIRHEKFKDPSIHIQD